MPGRKIALFLTLIAIPLAGCAQTSANEKTAPCLASPPYFVPSTAIVTNQHPGAYSPPTVALATNILPSSDSFLDIPRGERDALGTTPLSEYTAYSVFTYDVQAIGIRHSGYGYRYRWLQQSGFSASPALP